MFSRLVPFVCLLNLIGLVVLITLQFTSKEKAVYVDSSKLINKYQGMLSARQAYQGKVGVWKANMDTLVKEVKLEMARYEKESMAMSAKERELAQRLLQTKQQQLADYQKAISEKAGQEDAQATKKVIDEINAYLKSYGEKHQYTIIFAATEYGNIAYGNEQLDVTEEVLSGLNAQYSGKTGK